MWDAAGCLSLCFTALTQLQPGSVNAQELASIRAVLPDSLEQLPQQKAWEERQVEIVNRIVLGFANVHALVTSTDQLQQFRALPYIVIKAWAASDDLEVDSEDSVAVALD
jgi:hypothetical protein